MCWQREFWCFHRSPRYPKTIFQEFIFCTHLLITYHYLFQFALAGCKSKTMEWTWKDKVGAHRVFHKYVHTACSLASQLSDDGKHGKSTWMIIDVQWCQIEHPPFLKWAVSCLRFVENLALNLTFRSQKSTQNLDRKSIDWMRKGGNGHVGNSQRPIDALLDNVFVFPEFTDTCQIFELCSVCLGLCKSTYLQLTNQPTYLQILSPSLPLWVFLWDSEIPGPCLKGSWQWSAQLDLRWGRLENCWGLFGDPSHWHIIFQGKLKSKLQTVETLISGDFEWEQTFCK